MEDQAEARDLDNEYALRDLLTLQSAERYRRWIFSQVSPYLAPRTMEVGAGIGNMTSLLVPSCEYLLCLEPNPLCFHHFKSTFGNSPHIEANPSLLEDCTRDFLISRRLSCIVCINVLEHIKNDLAALQLMFDALPNGGRVVLFVPAVKSAYGPIDRLAGHYRRYSKPSMCSALQNAGFSIEKAQYMNFVGLLGWLFNARVTHRTNHSPLQMKLFERLLPFISAIERICPPPVGLSIFAVGHKK